MLPLLATHPFDTSTAVALRSVLINNSKPAGLRVKRDVGDDIDVGGEALYDLTSSAVDAVSDGGSCGTPCSTWVSAMQDCVADTDPIAIAQCSCKSATLEGLPACSSCLGGTFETDEDSVQTMCKSVNSDDFSAFVSSYSAYATSTGSASSASTSDSVKVADKEDNAATTLRCGAAVVVGAVVAVAALA
ncbi:hypothetical protein JCM6882_002405 [Rhodosporidiobolus microsporus]